MAYDAADGYVLLVGNGQSWKYAPTGWKQIPLATQPSVRIDSSMTYDPAEHAVLLFGGAYRGWTNMGAGYIALNDTWLFAAGSWIQWSGSTSPPASLDIAMAFDSEDNYTLLEDGIGTGETWSFAHGSWSKVAGVTPGGPTPRYGAALADDPRDGVVVLFGGASCGQLAACNDTWAFHAGSWRNLTATAGSAPSPRNRATFFFDVSSGSILLWGGMITVDGGLAPLGAWQFSQRGWAPVNESQSILYPVIRWGGAATYVTGLDQAMAYGGATSTGSALGDVWVYRDRTWAYVSTGATPPTPFCGCATVPMAYDAHDGYVVMLDDSTGRSPSMPVPVSGTWRFAAGQWTWWTETVVPPVYYGASMTYDAADQYVVLFGGFTATSELNQTWTYSAGQWTNRTKLGSPAPPPRDTAAMEYDPWDQYVVLFGGVSSTNWQTGYYDTWTYRAGNWSLLNTTALHPGARWGAGMAPDARDGGVLLFGGTTGCPDYCDYWILFNDTWLFRQGNWTVLPNASAPTGRVPGVLALDPTTNAVLLFGGGGKYGSRYDDTWEYVAQNWTLLNTSAAPASDWYPSAWTSDKGDREVLMFGGPPYGETDRNAYFDTWAFQGQAFRSTVNASPEYGPSPVNIALAASEQGGAPPISYHWSLGDGATASNTSGVNHTYATPGLFTAVLNATDGNSNWSTSSVLIAVQSNLSVTLTSTRPTGEAPFNVSFGGLATGGSGSYRYIWSFGDGTGYPGTNRTSHTYQDPGTYRVVLTAVDGSNDSAAAGLEVSTFPGSLSTTVNVTPSVGFAPLEVRFNSQTQHGVPPFSFNWSFGDGAMSSLSSPHHLYSAAGTYAVQLVVTDWVGNSSVSFASITAVRPLSAAAEVEPLTGSAPLAVHFQATVSGGGPLTSFEWRFGDGSAASTLTTSHVFDLPGRFTALFLASDQLGEAVTAGPFLVEVNLTRSPAPLAANFTVVYLSETCLSDSSVTNNVSVFAVVSGGVPPYAYAWTLPTGSAVGPRANTTLTYASNTIELIVQDAQGHSVTHQRAVALLVPLPCPPPAPKSHQAAPGPPSVPGWWIALVAGVTVAALAAGAAIWAKRRRGAIP